jgi:hypothetical protein
MAGRRGISMKSFECVFAANTAGIYPRKHVVGATRSTFPTDSSGT